jgi:MFS family permease
VTSLPDSGAARQAARLMSVHSVLVITVLAITGYRGSKVLLSLFALQLGADPAQIGVLMAFYGIGPLALAVIAGKMSDRLGFYAPLLGGSLCFSIGLLLPGFLPRLSTLFLSAALVGVGFVFYAVTAQGLVGALGTPATRTRDFSTFSLGPAIATFLGPLAAGFAVDHVGHAFAYLLLSLAPLIATGYLYFLRKRFPAVRKTAKGERGGSFELWQRPILRDTFIVGGIVLSGLELFTFYMPVYGHSVGLSATAIGSVMSAYAVAAIAVRLFLPALTRRLGEARTLTWALLASAATFLLFPLSQSAWILAGVSFMLGLSLGCGQPLGQILAYNRSPAGRVNEVIGMRVTVNKLAEVACPLLFGVLGSTFGVGLVFVVNALMMGGGGWINRRTEHA